VSPRVGKRRDSGGVTKFLSSAELLCHFATSSEYAQIGFEVTKIGIANLLDGKVFYIAYVSKANTIVLRAPLFAGCKTTKDQRLLNLLSLAMATHNREVLRMLNVQDDRRSDALS